MVLGLVVEVEECRVFPGAGGEPFPVGDLRYGDAQGNRATEVVNSRSDALQDLVQRSC